MLSLRQWHEYAMIKLKGRHHHLTTLTLTVTLCVSRNSVGNMINTETTAEARPTLNIPRLCRHFYRQ